MCANIEILPEADIGKVFLAFGSPQIEEYESRGVIDSL
jgi:hypothetical protein